MYKKYLLGFALGACLALSGCAALFGDVRPDETKVVAVKPLSMPPSFDDLPNPNNQKVSSNIPQNASTTTLDDILFNGDK